MKKTTSFRKEIFLCSKKDGFPIKVAFTDRHNNTTCYLLIKTRREKLLLQKPFNTTFKKELKRRVNH
jgi:hypothetical protein